MTSSMNGFPKWFKLSCCAVPLTALLVATVGTAMGSVACSVIFVPLTVLSWRVISNVLGIKPKAVVINQSAGRAQGTVTRR